jgi:DNA-binding MarR family transcriptional regulator
VEGDDIARLRSAIGRLARKLNVTATHEGLTPAEASILGVVTVRGPLTPSELAATEGVHPTMISRIVVRLAAAGLIERRPQAEDLRSVMLHATRTGRATHQRIRRERGAVLSACVDRLGPDAEAALVAALPALEGLVAELQHMAR